MSIQLIQQYHAKIEQMIRYGGSRNERTLRKPFQDLLERYARSKNLVLVPEVEYATKTGHRIELFSADVQGLADALRGVIEEQFTINRVVDEYEDLYLKLFKGDLP